MGVRVRLKMFNVFQASVLAFNCAVLRSQAGAVSQPVPKERLRTTEGLAREYGFLALWSPTVERGQLAASAFFSKLAFDTCHTFLVRYPGFGELRRGRFQPVKIAIS